MLVLVGDCRLGLLVREVFLDEIFLNEVLRLLLLRICCFLGVR